MEQFILDNRVAISFISAGFVIVAIIINQMKRKK